MRSPRALAAAIASVSLVCLAGRAVGAQAGTSNPLRVTLLGTGSPQLSLVRFGPSILVEAGDQHLVFDAGRGAAQRLAQLGVPFAEIDGVFLTHLHSDHVVGLPDLWLSGWVVGRRTTAWNVFGPPGTAAMVDHLTAAFAFDVGVRGGRDPEGARLIAHEAAPGVIYERGGLRVTAFLVDHRPVAPAYGYRIEYGGHTAVLSGDTRFSTNLIESARGAELLVHEVVLAPPDIAASAPYYGAFTAHTTPEQAAEVFGRVRPVLAVYSHVVVFGDRAEAEILQRTKALYAGTVVLGQDLMSVAVGDSTPTPHVYRR
jgi:ribonuclease Z